MPRREFSISVKKAAWARCGGLCEDCGQPFDAARRPEYDHDNPDGLTGEPTLENCTVRCRHCHATKTTADRQRIAKAHRLERKARGIVRKKRPIGDQRFRKKLDGTVVRK